MKREKQVEDILTHEMLVLRSYRNQSIDLLCKSIG